MDILKKIYLLPLALLVTSCYEEVDINVGTDLKLCLNSLITAGEPIEVEVTHTWLYTDPTAENNHSVNDATVSIYANGELKNADYIPQEGDAIKIVATSPTYGKAEAEVTVPVSAPVDFDWSITPISFRAGDSYDFQTSFGLSFNLSATMNITDPVGVDNYYGFSYGSETVDYYYGEDDDFIGGESFYNQYMGTLVDDIEPIFSEHIGTFEDVSGSTIGRFLFFTDRQFQDKSYTLHIRFRDGGFYVYTNDFKDSMLDCNLVMILSTMSKSYYNWAYYLWQEGEGILGDLGEVGMADRIWAYSNVSTGAGVVAAQSCKTYKVDLRPYLEQLLKDNNVELPTD
jgi:hypothetical protein